MAIGPPIIFVSAACVLSPPVRGRIRIETVCDAVVLPVEQELPISGFRAIDARGFEGTAKDFDAVEISNGSSRQRLARRTVSFRMPQGEVGPSSVRVNRKSSGSLGESFAKLPQGARISGISKSDAPQPSMLIDLPAGSVALIFAHGNAIQSIELARLVPVVPATALGRRTDLPFVLRFVPSSVQNLSIQLTPASAAVPTEAKVSFATAEDSSLLEEDSDDPGSNPVLGDHLILSGVLRANLLFNGRKITPQAVTDEGSLEISGREIRLVSLRLDPTSGPRGDRWGLAAVITAENAVVALAGQPISPRLYRAMLATPPGAAIMGVGGFVLAALFLFGLYRWIYSDRSGVGGVQVTNTAPGAVIYIAESIEGAKTEIQQQLNGGGLHDRQAQLLMQMLSAIGDLESRISPERAAQLLRDVGALSKELRLLSPRREPCVTAVSDLKKGAFEAGPDGTALGVIVDHFEGELYACGEPAFDKNHPFCLSVAGDPQEKQRMSQHDVSVSGIGNIVNIAEFMNQVTNTVNQNVSQAAAPQDAKKLVNELAAQIAELAPKLEPGVAQQMGSDVEALSREMALPEPRPKWYDLSLSGIKEAAEAIGAIGKPVVETVLKLMPLLVQK